LHPQYTCVKTPLAKIAPTIRASFAYRRRRITHYSSPRSFISPCCLNVGSCVSVCTLDFSIVFLFVCCYFEAGPALRLLTLLLGFPPSWSLPSLDGSIPAGRRGGGPEHRRPGAQL
jgi:hypothetical protein